MADTLIIDFKIDRLIKEICKELKDKDGKPLEYQTIVDVIESQIDATVDGMARGDTVIWKYFGTFVATKRAVDALNKKYISKGKTPTLQDNGLMRMSFKRSGVEIGSTTLEATAKKDLLEVPEQYKI